MGHHLRVGERLVGRLVEGADVNGVLEELGLTPEGAVTKLKSARVRQLIRARRRLGRVQAALLAARWRPTAVGRLIQLMSATKEGKPELMLRAAVAVLMSEKGERRRGAGKEKKREFDPTEGFTRAELEGALEGMWEARRRERLNVSTDDTDDTDTPPPPTV